MANNYQAQKAMIDSVNNLIQQRMKQNKTTTSQVGLVIAEPTGFSVKVMLNDSIYSCIIPEHLHTWIHIDDMVIVQDLYNNGQNKMVTAKTGQVGTNLILNSDFSQPIVIGNSVVDGWGFTGTTYNQVGGNLIVKFENEGHTNSSRFTIWVAGDKFTHSTDDTYTFSFRVKSDSDNEIIIRGGGLFPTPNTATSITNNFETYSVQLTSDGNDDSVGGAIVGYLKDTGTLDIDWVKFEKGNIATKYSLAPEDRVV